MTWDSWNPTLFELDEALYQLEELVGIHGWEGDPFTGEIHTGHIHIRSEQPNFIICAHVSLWNPLREEATLVR